MPITPKVPLGGDTLARKWYLDVRVPGTLDWIGVFGMTEFTPSFETLLQDVSDYDSEGWKSNAATAKQWKAEGKFRRAGLAADPTSYDPGQELIRNYSVNLGNGNLLECRIYEMPEPDFPGPKVEAYQGLANTQFGEEGGSMEAVSMAAFTLTGFGKRVSIPHPDAP